MDTENSALRYTPQTWLKPAALGGAALAAVLVAVGLASRGMAHQQQTAWTQTQAIPTVDVIRPALGSAAETLVLPGNVQAFNDDHLHARVSGYLKRWTQDIGAQVKAGEVLAEIDTPDLDQQLAQAKAQLATAQAGQNLAAITARRWSGLLQQDAVSKQETDEKTGDLEAKMSVTAAARAEVQRLEALEAFKHIVAPFDGVVTARNIDIGDLVTAGDANSPSLFTVSDVHQLRIYVRVPQSYAAAIKPGETASLTVPDYPGRVFHAVLATTADAVSDQSGSLLVELHADNADGALKPGDYAQVTFDLPRAAGTVQAPASALMFRHSGMVAAVVGPDDHVILKPVTLGRDFGQTVEITSGLNPGDALIDNPPDSLRQGDLVRVAGASAKAAS